MNEHNIFANAADVDMHENHSASVVLDVDMYMASVDQAMLYNSNQLVLCSYHRELVLGLGNMTREGQGIMERFLAEGMSEQNAVFVHPAGDLSITKPCTCGEKIDADMKLREHMTQLEISPGKVAASAHEVKQL